MGSIPSILVLRINKLVKLNLCFRPLFTRSFSSFNQTRPVSRPNLRRVGRKVFMSGITGTTISSINSGGIKNTKTVNVKIRIIKASGRKFLKPKRKPKFKYRYNTYDYNSLLFHKPRRSKKRLFTRNPRNSRTRPKPYKEFLRFNLFLRLNYGFRLRSKRKLATDKTEILSAKSTILSKSGILRRKVRVTKSRLSGLAKRGLQTARKRLITLRVPRSPKKRKKSTIRRVGFAIKSILSHKKIKTISPRITSLRYKSPLVKY